MTKREKRDKMRERCLAALRMMVDAYMFAGAEKDEKADSALRAIEQLRLMGELDL